MTDALKARDANDVEDAVRWALAEGKTPRLQAEAPSARSAARASPDRTLDLSGLRGVTLYGAGGTGALAQGRHAAAEIEALVGSRDQQLAFEPMDYGPDPRRPGRAGLPGGALGGELLSGPRWIKAGAARDHFLGFSAVPGRAETFKSGGRVVKNVTGYDLCKLLAGSFGTLAAMTDVTIKVLPSVRRPKRRSWCSASTDADANRGDVGGDGVILRCVVVCGASAAATRSAHFAGLYVERGRDRVRAWKASRPRSNTAGMR